MSASFYQYYCSRIYTCFVHSHVLPKDTWSRCDFTGGNISLMLQPLAEQGTQPRSRCPVSDIFRLPSFTVPLPPGPPPCSRPGPSCYQQGLKCLHEDDVSEWLPFYEAVTILSEESTVLLLTRFLFNCPFVINLQYLFVVILTFCWVCVLNILFQFIIFLWIRFRLSFYIYHIYIIFIYQCLRLFSTQWLSSWLCIWLCFIYACTIIYIPCIYIHHNICTIVYIYIYMYKVYHICCYCC